MKKVFRVTVNGVERELSEGTTLETVANLYSPMAVGDPVLIRYNGKVYNSILHNCRIPVSPGDRIDIYPLILGG
ncbi:MAG: hypothetical protein ACOX36_06875 [Saccharofermentanales bacterium]|jgi:sulfur carrier protein ThiS